MNRLVPVMTPSRGCKDWKGGGAEETPYTFSWLQGVPQDLAFAASYQRLLTRAPQATIFQTWEWVSCAMKHLVGNRVLYLVCVWETGELAACLPVTWGLERVHGLTVRSIRVLGEGLADYMPLLVAGEDGAIREVLLDALAMGPRSWDVVILSELPEQADERSAIEQWGRGRRLKLHWRSCTRAPILELLGRSGAEVRQHYSKTLRTRLHRSRKKLDAAGAVRFERVLPTSAQTDGVIDQCKSIEDASWKGQQGIGIFSTAERLAFFREVAKQFAARGWLDIGWLSLDAQVVSYRFGFRYQDVFLDYSLSFHPTYAELSPGRILLDDMVASSADLGLKAVDASHGGIEHGHQLQEWTSLARTHVQLWIMNRTLQGQGLYWLRERVRPGMKWLASRLARRRESGGE